MHSVAVYKKFPISWSLVFWFNWSDRSQIKLFGMPLLTLDGNFCLGEVILRYFCNIFWHRHQICLASFQSIFLKGFPESCKSSKLIRQKVPWLFPKILSQLTQYQILWNVSKKYSSFLYFLNFWLLTRTLWTFSWFSLFSLVLFFPLL